MITLIILCCIILVILISVLVVGLPILVVLCDVAIGIGTIALVVFIFRLPGKIVKKLTKKNN